jgi:hypothetical protein
MFQRYKLGLVPSDIRFYLRFDAQCSPSGLEKRDTEPSGLMLESQATLQPIAAGRKR